MKIMYCITSASWGGAQLHVLELCQHQIDLGNEVVFVVGNDGLLLDKVKKIGKVKIISLPTLHRELSLVNDCKVIFDLRKIIKKEEPDILHLHSSKAGTVGRLASIGLSVKTIFTVHGWAFTNGISSNIKKKIYQLIEKIVSPLTDYFICVSKYDYDIGEQHGILKITKHNYAVVHNGVPEPTEKNITHNLENEAIKIVMIARFSAQKDQTTLIKAISQISNRNFLVTFVGDGSTLEENQKLVKDMKLDKRVKFVGFKQNVIPYLINNDLYILSTHYEGLPISLIEAMSYGLPLIASDVGGNSELVSEGVNGFLVKPEDEQQLAERITCLLNDSSLLDKFGVNSFNKYKKEFEISRMLSKIDQIYCNLK
ncbi:glycosyltransferase family 4 protein [Paucilactobacillus wasatchensis]|uniref:Glycosyltransferase n=1 Tax=Paucilactobacillus wasatchensis TaxID=1335616 RepID=A0A0D1A9D6_9LACO|nr:glycosyltransferase family 4 protein [Paucilactobacillus wasatchensis]KIS04342.1 glycosyltransferase [Paucilactobacillus wasatchensis]